MSQIKLPDDLSTLTEAAELNRSLHLGQIELDWSGVRRASEAQVRELLAGLDLDRHADAIGVATIPDELGDLVIGVCGTLPANDEKDERAVAVAPAAPTLVVSPEQAAALREQLIEMVQADLLGPAGGTDEEVAESHVSDRYLVGMLAPRRLRHEEPVQEELALETSDDEGDGAERTSAAPSMFPSSLGLSFAVDERVAELSVTASWGHYQRGPSANATTPTGQPKRVWKRRAAGGEVRMKLLDGPLGPLAPDKAQPQVTVQGVARRRPDGLVVTLFLVNGQDEPEEERDQAWLFQAELEVAHPDGRPVFVRRIAKEIDGGRGEEAAAMAMLYRNRVEFAAGHATAVHWDLAGEDTQRAVRLKTVPFPQHEVARMTPRTAEDDANLAGLVLDMRSLADASAAQLARLLEPLPAAYETWIAAQETATTQGRNGLASHRTAASAAMQRCRRSARRIREGLALLATDPAAAEAFRFANRAMALQRVHSLYAEKRARSETIALETLDVPSNRTWFPFQMGFVLQSLPGLTRLDHADRADTPDAVADLLWFPTGGGKTEAYLGLAAYTMALRRLQGEVEGRRGDVGVAVLMRYTLRVLTIQQFQRAAALLCACEVIRREELGRGERRYGDEPFRIGLWVGQRTTPNWTDHAAEALTQARGRGGQPGAARGSPEQLEHCPWCGRRIDPGRDMEVEPYNQGAARTFTYCGDPAGECPFSRRAAPREGLPVIVVDEEIYRLLPSMLVATVDKFAQMPWNGTIQMLFGHVEGRCPRHGFRSSGLDDSDSHPTVGRHPAVRTQEIQKPLRPPDLIIQDELHLISGPLGTLTGLYETAVDALCTWEVGGRLVRPKVVASTATIRRAREQVNALFSRSVQVFPPHGLDVEDSFFALERAPGLAPGRRYVGVCAPGRRLKAVLIRSYVAFLSAAQRLFELQGRRADPWMTLVGYFGSIRELAGMRRLVEDDVRSRCRDMDRRGLARRKLGQPQELTSRIGSTDIPRLLSRMELPFEPGGDRKTSRPLDVLLATNMISVGVDVKRLGLMVVAGQPKTTAEYIQATSRVGRSHPGVVCTVYNWARPRDLSHFERFGHYHDTFYQQVEATSVTPFSSRALDRGLSALLVALVRLSARKYNPNHAASGVEREDELVRAAIEQIVGRAERVTGSKAAGQDVRAALKRRLDTWLHEAHRTVGLAALGYRMERDGSTRGLLESPGLGRWQDFTCLTSLRDVEPNVNLVLDDRPMDDRPLWRAP